MKPSTRSPAPAPLTSASRRATAILGAALAVLAPGCAGGESVEDAEVVGRERSSIADPTAWLTQVYLDVLSRAPDPDGLAAWRAQLDAGTSPTAVARMFFDSPEWQANWVRVLYGIWLHRAADDGGLAFHVGNLAEGRSMVSVMSDFLASQEYFDVQCGGTRQGYVVHLYRDVLGREGSPDEVAAWVGSGEDREGLARAFLTSTEYRTAVLRLFYLGYLDREPDAAGLQGWLAQMASGMGFREVAAAFLGSEEYIARFGGDGSPTPACPILPGQPQMQAFFSDRTPVPGEDEALEPDADTAIEREIIRLFQAAVPGSKVRVSIYTFSRPKVAAAIHQALVEGVDVKILLDGEHDVEPAVASILTDFPDAVRICQKGAGGGGCIGTNINHNKLVTFSELCDGSRNVVVQSSANWTGKQLGAHNNMVVVRNDPALYDAYLGYWRAMRDDDGASPFAPYSVHEGQSPAKAFFFPRKPGNDAAPATDTVAEILDDVQCDPGGDDDWVGVTASLWGPARGYLLDRLAQLRSDGCRIKIRVNEEVELAGEIADRFPAARLVPRVHHKYILVNARFNGSAQPRRLVFTGSHNLNQTSLRSNDETILRLEDDAVFAAFEQNFNALE